jgi:hypothetical protein
MLTSVFSEEKTKSITDITKELGETGGLNQAPLIEECEPVMELMEV